MALSCPVCDGASAEKLEKDGIAIRRCLDCGSAFWRPEPGFDARALYGASYFEGTEDSSGYDAYPALEASLRANFRARLARLHRPRPDARLLDVGAAYGYAVDEARRAGWRAVGTEISPAAARAAARVARGSVAVADAAALPFADASFDALTLWDVLEHLADPHAAIAEAARVLARDGRLVLSTGDVGSLAARVCGARWHLYTLPEHLMFYSRAGLRALLERHDFAVERMRAHASLYPVGYLWERVRKTLLRRASSAGARARGGPSIPVNLFDIVTVTARRA